MKARSIQFKFLMTVISAILSIAVFVGGLCIYELDNYIQHQTEDLITTTCSNEVAQTNDVLSDIESSVRIMESYVLSLFKEQSDVLDREKQTAMLKLAGEMFVDVAANTNGAVAYYLRFDPEISDGKTGMFYSKTDGVDEYICFEPTDISAYERDDIEHVGWFWLPYDAGQPVWLAPYFNQNNGIMMISFVIPLYVEEQFIGVVGMDIDYTVLTNRINQIKIYENGFARLELNGAIIYTGGHHNSQENTEEYLSASEDLANGMTLVLFASYDDIRQIRLAMALKILISVILLASVFSIVVFFVVKKVVKPLKKLTEASIKLSSGDYDVDIEPSNTYEIQQLSAAFEIMIMNLREHEKLQHILAYRDSLTGLRNTTSYKKWVTDFNKKIKDESPTFGVIVFDVNDLKKTNDNFGHNAGNKMIAAASQIISDTFKRSPVFRIGGDEFLVILQNRDLEDRDDLFSAFESKCNETLVETESTNIPISIAKGFSMFAPDKDTQFSDVFKRADEEMYNNKKAIKEARK